MKKANKSVKHKVNENSTVFSNPKDVERKKSRRSAKKVISIVLSVFVLVFVVLPIIIVKIANGSQDSKPVRSFNEQLRDTKAYENGIALYGMTVSDVADSFSFQKITDALNVKGYCGEFTLKTSTAEASHSVTLTFDKEHDSSMDEWFENTMVKYSCVLLALCDELDEVIWEYPDNGSGDKGGSFTRDDAKQLLSVDIERYGQSEKSVQLLLNTFGLND